MSGNLSSHVESSQTVTLVLKLINLNRYSFLLLSLQVNPFGRFDVSCHLFKGGVPENLSKYFKNKTQGIPEVLSNYVKDKTRDLQVLSKPFKNRRDLRDLSTFF